MTVQPAHAQYPGSGGGSNTGSSGNTGYSDGTDGSNTDHPGMNTGDAGTGTSGTNNTGNTGGTGTSNTGTTGGNNTGSSTGYPGGGTDGSGTAGTGGNSTGSSTGTTGGTGGTGTGGSNTGYPGGGTGGSNTGSNTGYPGGGTGGTTTTPGHWDVSYSSQGTSSWDYQTDDSAVHSGSLPWSPTDSSASVGSSSYLDAATTGTISATLTWVPTTGQDSTSDPPASSVLVTETGSAGESGGGVGKGMADDGWGDPAGPGGPSGSSSDSSSSSASSSGTHYEVKDGSSGSISVGPFTLSASTPPNITPDANGNFFTVGAFASVGLAVAGNSITINPGSAVKDSSGNYNILVGQGCTANLNTPPFDVTKQSGWTWTVSSTTFQEWQPKTPPNPTATPPTPANPNASYEVDGYGPANKATAHWYWNDPGPTPTPETVTCSATVTPNDGKNAPFTVNVTQNVTVYVPSWTAFGVGGYVQVNIFCPDLYSQGYMGLWAGPFISPTASYDAHNGGMEWTATCATPQKPVAFGTGTLELVQLATPNRSYTTDTKPPVPHSYQMPKGLDSRYPYLSISPIPPASYVEGGPKYMAYDDPAIGLNYYNAKTASMAENFDVYLLYQPPGTDVRWVPLANFTWSTDTTNGSVTIPEPSDLWADYSVGGTFPDKAGTVYIAGKACTAPPTKTDFTPWHKHPSWTIINTFPAF